MFDKIPLFDATKGIFLQKCYGYLELYVLNSID